MGMIAGRKQLEAALERSLDEDDELPPEALMGHYNRVNVAPVRWLDVKLPFWDDDREFAAACASAKSDARTARANERAAKAVRQAEARKEKVVAAAGTCGTGDGSQIAEGASV
jgi:hypothetical protein